MFNVAAGGSKLGSYYFERCLRGFLAGRVAAQSIDYQEDAECVIDVAAVLIFSALAAGVGERGGSPFIGYTPWLLVV